ncbi:MAG: hypothetical protein AAFN08_08975 [Cyanobacteria bacterium J06559_3]
MYKIKTWHAIQLGMISTIVGLSGCPQGRQSALSNQTPPSPAIPVAQSAIAPAPAIDTASQTVNFEVCSDLPDWERPDLDTQTETLTSNPRYSDSLDVEPLQGLAEKFWNESIITFTTYGLSARTEPINLSGVWTAIDAMEPCYQGDRPEAINQGQLGEIWLIGHRIIAIEWSGDQYQVVVEPTQKGLQAIQFDRLETNETLPIVVVETDGTEVTVASGDW